MGPHDLIIAATALTKGYLYCHHSRRTQIFENAGIVVSTLVTRETDRVPIDSKIKDLALTFLWDRRSEADMSLQDLTLQDLAKTDRPAVSPNRAYG